MAKVKALLAKGLAELCSYMKKYIAALGDLASAVADGLDEKQDITAAVPFTIPTTGWARDSTLTSYFYCDISVAGLMATDIVEVTPDPESYNVAQAAGFICTESMAGKLRLRAKKVPTAAIKAQYHIVAAAVPAAKEV